MSVIKEKFMRNYIFWISFPILSLPIVLLRAQVDDKDVSLKANYERMRRGNFVSVTGPVESEDARLEIEAFVSAVEPPPDDSHKWYFTLVVTNNCIYCSKMLQDFETHPKLKAWVDVHDWKNSWAHWRVIQIGDKSQEWRWVHYRPRKFPTLIVQPPINGSWGDPKTVVYLREGYLDPDTLDFSIRTAIQNYAKKLYPNHVMWKNDAANKSVSLNEQNKSKKGTLESDYDSAPPQLTTNTIKTSEDDDFLFGQKPPQPAPPKLVLPTPPQNLPVPQDGFTLPPQADPKNLKRSFQMPEVQLNMETLLILLIVGWIVVKVIWPKFKEKVGVPLFLKENQKNLLLEKLTRMEKEENS